MRSWFPYGFTSFGNDRDLLADAEAGRLVLDNSRHADGTYRRDNKGYFAEIANLAGVGALGAADYYDSYSGTGRTPAVVGPTAPIMMPAIVVGPSGVGVPGADVAVHPDSIRQTSHPGAGVPGWAIGLGVGALGLGVVFLAMGGKGKRGRKARRRSR